MLVVVVMILGILAAVAAPKLLGTSSTAADNGLKETLSVIRDAVERFTLDAATMALKREYTAEDPVYLTAELKGSDSVAPSNVPYAAEACEDLTPTGAPTAGR